MTDEQTQIMLLKCVLIGGFLFCNDMGGVTLWKCTFLHHTSLYNKTIYFIVYYTSLRHFLVDDNSLE